MARKPDYAHRATDKELAELERRISAIYQEARGSLDETVKAYFESFRKRDEEMKKLIGTIQNGREWTEQDYINWRLAQIGRGERFKALRDKVAERMTKANETATAYVNDATPGIYSLNRNYAAYTIEQATGDVGFDLWDEQTVKRLIVEQPSLMPYYPLKRALRRGIDLAWGKKQITASVTSSILQGRSIKGMADDLQTRIPEMNRSSAIRTARTAVTGAQNAGRMDSYHAAEKMGIRMKKEWLATLDNRTRHAHAVLDGQQTDVDKPFKVNGEEIRYPGDPTASGYLVYNCRCTLIAAVDGVDTSDAQRRARDPKTGESKVIENMSYPEWAGWKKQTDRVEKIRKTDIIEPKPEKGGGSVRTICKIDREIYKVVSPVIRTDEVVITDERVQHIKERHPNDFEKYEKYIADILQNPQYIVEDKAPHTAVILNEYIENGKRFRLILRLSVPQDPPNYKNSIITFLEISERKFNKYLRNKKVLYKSE